MHTNNTYKQAIPVSNSTSFHRYLFGMILTDSAMQFATTYQCFWLLDLVAAYQYQLTKISFQLWTLRKNMDSTAWLIAADINGKILIRQHIKRTDFEVTEATVLVDDKIILLSSKD